MYIYIYILECSRAHPRTKKFVRILPGGNETKVATIVSGTYPTVLSQFTITNTITNTITSVDTIEK